MDIDATADRIVEETLKPRPTLGLVMIVAADEPVVGRCLDTVADKVGWWTIVNTGGADLGTNATTDTINLLGQGGVEGELHRRDWVSFGHNRTEALELARGKADWLLTLDADMTVEMHDHFVEWLAGDPDPNVDAWMVEVVEGWGSYRLPLLTRGDIEWRYDGATHEALHVDHDRTRPVTGLAVRHHEDGSNRAEKFLRDLELLRPGYESGDPRATFYYAQTMRGLGRNEAAIIAYNRRAAMTDTWEEERWYAQFQAASLAGDVGALLAAHQARPWRHEPLAAAAKILAGRPHNDTLFRETL